MALQKDLDPIKEKLKKLAAELVAQGISDQELKEKLKQEKEKLLPTKKDQLQETGAAVEVNEASDTVSSSEGGSSDSQVETKAPVQKIEEVAVEQDKPDPIKKPDIKDQSKVGAMQLYENMYSNSGFEFEDSLMAGSVNVLAPNGESQRFRVESGGGRKGKKITDWTSVDKFIEENNDKEAWDASKKQRKSLTSIVENIVEREDYYNFLDLEGVAIKDNEDLYYNHPKVVEGIEKEAIKRYNQYNVQDSEKTFFGDSAFQVSGITDNRLKKITSQAIQTEIQKDKIFDLKQEEDLIVKEAADNFNGSTNSLVDYYTKIGALGISNPTEKTIASNWSTAYSLQQKLKGKELSTTERLAFENQLADASQKAKALTKQYIDPSNSVLFDFENNTTEITSKSDPESKSINITSAVDLARAELANLKSTDFGSLQRRYVVNSMELSDIEKRLNKEYEVVQSDGGKRKASLRRLVGQYITGEGKFGGAMTKGLKAYGEKSENSESGTIQEVLDKTTIGLVAKEYLQLKGEAEALKQMYLLNIDPGSVERTGFFGALGESFLESVSSPDVVDYYTGKNSSDLLFTAQSVGNEAGIEWNDTQKKNFKETTSEFVGTSLGGLPVLAAEFAVANVAAGVALGATGLEAGLTALKVGKYYKKGRKAAMTLDEITTAAAADGYKGSILSKPVQTWIKNQPTITKVGGGVVDQGKALFVDSMVEGLKMESVMGEGGFAMGAAFLPAASLTNKLVGKLGLGFKAKGAFAPLNDVILKPAKSGLVMIPSAEGGAVIEAAIDSFAGSKDFGKYVDENFKSEFYGEGGIGRRLLGHAVAGFGLSYSHLNPKTIFKSLREQKVLRANAITEYKNIQNKIKQEQLLEGSESRIDLLEQEGAKQLEVYTLANNFISNAYALNAATDPQTSAKQAQKDIQKARQDFKKLTGKEMDMNFSIEMQGEGMDGKAASATKLENGTWDVKVDARKYHKGIFGHELGHFYSDVFKINDSEGLGKIVNFVNETVKKTTGTDVKALVNSKYEGKQDAETLNEEYMMALVETLGKNDSSGLVNKNAFGDIANSLKGLYERKMKPFYKEGNVPEMRIESPQELLTLLQRISKGAGKGGNVKQWQQLQGLYIQNKKIFNGKSKEVLGEYGSENVSAEIESQIEALEEKLGRDEIDYDTYESQLVTLENKLEAAEKQGKSEVTKTAPRTYTKREKLEKIDIDKQYEELTKLREENETIAKKFGKDPIKGANEKRIENEIIESLSDPIGKLITGRTKALFDPIPEDARAGVTREKFQESMRSDLVAMVLNEYKPGKQSAEKFLINRGYLRANNLAKRLGIQSAEAGINKGMEAAEKVATETSVSESVPEGRLIEPVERLITDPKLKTEFIEKVNEATKDLTPEQVNYKNLTDAASGVTEKVFGQVFKDNGKLDKGKTLKQRQQFVRNNAEVIYKLLPEGARKMADKFSTSTGIQASLLKNFYEKGERVDMTKGTEAGLATQTKKPFNETAFLELFGANKNQKPSRNHETAITALMKEIGKAMTNRVYRQKLEAADVSMNTIQKIADGKSVNMASENVSNELGISFLEKRATEEDFRKLVSTVSKNLPKYYGELTPELINSAAKRNQFVEDVVAERILAEASWNIAYKKANIPYTKLSEVGNDVVGKDGKAERSELVKGLKILAEEFGDIESLPPFIRKTLLATLGVNQRLLINGNKISQKATGTTNSKDMLSGVFGELNFKDGSQNLDYKYAYAPTPGKGKWNKADVGGKGFNGKVENKIASLREKYKNNTDNNEFRQELSDFVRKELTHPELRGQADGFDLTVQANTKLLEKTYNTLYDAVKSGKLSVQGAADVLRIQTNHGTGIFKLLVPYESVTMGGIGKYKKGNKKNTHNEHMVELQNYNLDFVEILKKSENATEAKESIEALVNSLGQSIVDVPTQRVKDSKRYGGSSKQVYADRVLNTFLRTNSLNNSLVISGPYKGYTQGEKLFQELGADGLRKALDRVDSKRKGKQWTEISEALNKLKERKLASENLSEEFGKIVTRTSGETRSFSDVTAKIEAGQKGKYKFFVSASADDFVGLMNYNAGKGKRGEADQEFLKKNLYEPYAKAYTLINNQNVQMAKQFKDIKKHIESNSPDFNLTKKVPGSKFTYEQALRVAIWDKQGYEIPGLSKAEVTNLKKVIDSNVNLQVLALNLKRIAGGEYVKPGKDWYAGDVAGDLRLGLNTTLRTKYLKDWKNNVDAMFTPEALNKLEAIHGTPYRKSLEEMLEAMYTGKTRRTSPNSLEGRSLNYLNNSVGTIMFLNQRSATLQMLSSFNYINWSDNNPLQAGKALANIPQFSKDFKTLFNSDWAKSRREGLRINVTESEIAEAVNGSKNIPKSITAFLLKKGFLPTQIADSMATALGGASFYRNRTNTYVKEGMTQEKAEAKAMQDWVEISETNQQSSRPDKISSQQRSDLGKLLLAFANTPMQYTRETKKALLDIKNGRGDIKTNLSKVAYYAFAQNAIFSGLQSAIFKMAWSDDEQDQIFLEKKAPKIINSMGDSFLRGMGIGGALVSTLKNAGIKLYERADRGSRARLKDVAFDLLDVSPPISSKVGKVYSALDAIDRAGGIEAAAQAPVDLKNPLIKSSALMTEAFVNVPANRALQKIQTITEAASSNREWYEKLALLSGWKSWEIDPEVVYKSKKEKFSERKAKRQEVFKKMSYKDYQTYKRWKKLKVNNGKDIVDFVELKKGK